MMEVEAMTNSSESGSDAESESEINDIDVQNLRPYEFEPELSDGSNDSADEAGDSQSVSSDEEDHEEDTNATRIGNTDWCTCSCCRTMTTYEESICCKDDVPQDRLGDHSCITAHDDFAVVILHEAVLKTTLSMLNNLRGDSLNYENNALRYAAYRQFTWWIYNRLGQGVRRVIPSCVLWAIRDRYPDVNGAYVPFQEATEEDNRLL